MELEEERSLLDPHANSSTRNAYDAITPSDARGTGTNVSQDTSLDDTGAHDQASAGERVGFREQCSNGASPSSRTLPMETPGEVTETLRDDHDHFMSSGHIQGSGICKCVLTLLSWGQFKGTLGFLI